MKKINMKTMQSLQGGICIAPQGGNGGQCLPCAAVIAMGGGLAGVGGMPTFICPL